MKRLLYCEPGERANKKRSWFYDFFNACSTSAVNKTLPNEIDADHGQALRKTYL